MDVDGAIDIFNDIIEYGWLVSDYEKCKVIDACEMGIEALKVTELHTNNSIDYRRAFKIACELLNGDNLYGVDSDKIFEIMHDKDEVVSNYSYEEYILNHLQELDHGQYAVEPATKDDSRGECMNFPHTFDEFANEYGFKDKEEVYSNGDELIPVFRVKQWLEHIQEPRKGHWITEDDFAYCSECEFPTTKVKIESTGTYIPFMTRYCPNCGAEMREDNQ